MSTHKKNVVEVFYWIGMSLSTNCLTTQIAVSI